MPGRSGGPATPQHGRGLAGRAVIMQAPEQRNHAMYASQQHDEDAFEANGASLPPAKRQRMLHWSQQDGPLTRGFARQREMAESRPLPAQLLPTPAPAAPQWINDLRASVTGPARPSQMPAPMSQPVGPRASGSRATIGPSPLLVHQDKIRFDSRSAVRMRDAHQPSHLHRGEEMQVDIDEPGPAFIAQVSSPSARGSAASLKTEAKRRPPNDIDSFGMNKADRKRTSSEALSTNWSTLEAIEQLKKRVAGTDKSEIVNTQGPHSSSTYNTFQPIWKPKPKNLVTTEAKFTLPIRTSRSASRESSVFSESATGGNTSKPKRTLFMPDKPSKPSDSGVFSTARKLKGKAGRVLASLVENSITKSIERPEKKQEITISVETPKHVLYRRSRLQAVIEEEGSSPSIRDETSSLPNGLSSPPTSPCPATSMQWKTSKLPIKDASGMPKMRLDAGHAVPLSNLACQQSDGYPQNEAPMSYSQHFEEPADVHSSPMNDSIEGEDPNHIQGAQYDQHEQASQRHVDNAITALHQPLYEEYDYEAPVPYGHSQQYGHYSQSPALALQYQQSPDRSASGAAQSGASVPGIGHQHEVQRMDKPEAARPQYRQQSRSFVPQQNQPETDEGPLQQRAGWLSNFWRR